MGNVLIIGAGLAGLSAALTLAEADIPCCLISAQPSERAQSVLAEGGINAALDTMGEHDTPAEHFADTVRGGCDLADENAVRHLTESAAAILRRLTALGVPFNMQGDAPVLRNFGGQKKKRTAYARSSTGKVIMNAMIDAVRRYEESGLVTRCPHHTALDLITDAGRCIGVRVQDRFTGESADFYGSVLLCCGGLNGVFPGKTTGTTQNTGDLTAAAFAKGVLLANPEMLQYHPTTVGISGKRCLVTEAARGEGGRLYILRGGEKWYFMEEKYPELGNLMPRDVVAREMYFVRQDPRCGGQVYLDLTGLTEETWRRKLSDLRAELMDYLALDPKTDPIPVEEGIHYFMGGIDTDTAHRTNLAGLYAAGECCAQYHGANRLGGNSMLGALLGGQTAAQTILADGAADMRGDPVWVPYHERRDAEVSPADAIAIRDILLSGLGIVRDADSLERALEQLEIFARKTHNPRTANRILLGKAMLLGALGRRESRGAHYRSDYPLRDDFAFRKTTVAQVCGGDVQISFRHLPETGGV